jgi:hypothetical protein
MEHMQFLRVLRGSACVVLWSAVFDSRNRENVCFHAENRPQLAWGLLLQ